MAKAPTLTERVDALTAAVEALTTLVAAQVTPAQSNTAAPAAATETKRSKDGRDFPCTADGGCGRFLRSGKRAAIHGIDAGGHAPAA